MCATRGAESPGQREKQLTQTLIVPLLKRAFFHRSLIVKSQQNIIELVNRPGPRPALVPRNSKRGSLFLKQSYPRATLLGS